MTTRYHGRPRSGRTVGTNSWVHMSVPVLATSRPRVVEGRVRLPSFSGVRSPVSVYTDTRQQSSRDVSHFGATFDPHSTTVCVRVYGTPTFRPYPRSRSGGSPEIPQVYPEAVVRTLGLGAGRRETSAPCPAVLLGPTRGRDVLPEELLPRTTYGTRVEWGHL